MRGMSSDNQCSGSVYSYDDEIHPCGLSSKAGLVAYNRR